MPRPAHLRAVPKDVAELVVTCGDPARTEQLAMTLKDAKLVNSNRGFTTYSGYYKGKRVTVSTHGVGGPSASIVFEELRMLGAKVIVRFGTTGGLVRDLHRGDLVVPTGAAYAEGSLKAYVQDGVIPAVPDLDLTKRIVERCRAERVKCKSGLVFSSDAFYAEDPKVLGKWTERGVVSVEMECATLFTLGHLRGFRTTSLLIVSNSLVNKAEGEMADSEELRSYVERGGRILLNALTSDK
ncbi:MAG: purine-nucleoside phosphorylase [Thaumarchaeota archaeon]|nr:purine-nucleoside phosphorylase [Nitrososphaerota archaeon]